MARCQEELVTVRRRLTLFCDDPHGDADAAGAGPITYGSDPAPASHRNGPPAATGYSSSENAYNVAGDPVDGISRRFGYPFPQ